VWITRIALDGVVRPRDQGRCIGLRRETGGQPKISFWGQGSGEQSPKAIALAIAARHTAALLYEARY
jgi:hypothetical protein